MLLIILTFLVLLVFFMCTAYGSNGGKPKNGIYSQSSFAFPIKFVIFYILLMLKRLQDLREKRKGFDQESHRKSLDRPQSFSGNPQGFDAVFFSGGNNRTGECLIIATERRPENLTYGILYLLVPGKGLFRGSWLPITSLSRSDKDNEAEAFEGGSIRLTPIEPMRRWKIGFQGQVTKCFENETVTETRNEVLDILLDLEWSSDAPVFTYDTDMSPCAAARAFAKETWNKQFFQDLKGAHQTHYEQMGQLKGEMVFKGESREISMDSFRDHSFGMKRDWKLMHRYIFHHIFLSDGMKAVVGIVCQPHTCSSLECGFVSWSGSGRVSAVDSCDLQLAYHGEGGTMPKNYGFMFTSGGLEFDVQVTVISEVAHYLGQESEAKNIERFVNYTINGVPGVGITEWNYRNVE